MWCLKTKQGAFYRQERVISPWILGAQWSTGPKALGSPNICWMSRTTIWKLLFWATDLFLYTPLLWVQATHTPQGGIQVLYNPGGCWHWPIRTEPAENISSAHNQENLGPWELLWLNYIVFTEKWYELRGMWYHFQRPYLSILILSNWVWTQSLEF